MRVILSNEEMAVALSEMHLEGLAEFLGDDKLRLSDSGLDKGFEMLSACHRKKD